MNFKTRKKGEKKKETRTNSKNRKTKRRKRTSDGKYRNCGFKFLKIEWEKRAG